MTLWIELNSSAYFEIMKIKIDLRLNLKKVTHEMTTIENHTKRLKTHILNKCRIHIILKSRSIPNVEVPKVGPPYITYPRVRWFTVHGGVEDKQKGVESSSSVEGMGHSIFIWSWTSLTSLVNFEVELSPRFIFFSFCCNNIEYVILKKRSKRHV